MIPYSQAIYSSSRQASSKKEFAPNFQKNNKQIIALFAPKPIQSRTSSNQYFASKNETFDQSKNSLQIQRASKQKDDQWLYGASKNQKLSQNSQKMGLDNGLRQYDDLQQAKVKKSYEAQIIQRPPKETENQRQKEILQQQENENDDTSNDVKVYRAKTQVYNHQRDLQIAGKEILQILNQSKNRQQTTSDTNKIFIESTENPHASFLDKLIYRQESESFGDFSTCSEINMMSNPCLFNIHDCNSNHIQRRVPIHNLRSMNNNHPSYYNDQDGQDEDPVDDTNEQFFFGEADHDEDCNSLQSIQKAQTVQKGESIRTLHDILAQQQDAFHSRQESFYHIASDVSNYMNNKSQKKVTAHLKPQYQSQNQPWNTSNFLTQQ